MSRATGTGEDGAGRGAAWLVELARVTALLGELHAATSRLAEQLAERFDEPMSAGEADDVPDEAILALVRDRPRSTTTQIAGRARCTVGGARAAVARLVESGRLERHGNGRGSYYTLPDTAATYGSSPEAEAQRAQRVLALARLRGPLTSHLVHLELGLSPHHTRQLLARMVREGTLVRRGHRRGTTYVLLTAGGAGAKGGVSRRGSDEGRGRNGERDVRGSTGEARSSGARVVSVSPPAAARSGRDSAAPRSAPRSAPPGVAPGRPVPQGPPPPRGAAAGPAALPPLPQGGSGLPPSISLESLLAAQEAERGGRRRGDDPDPGADPDSDLDLELGDDPDDEADPVVETILTIFVDGAARSAVEVASELGLPYQRVAGELATLVEGGMLEQRGRGRASKFVLSDS